MYKRQSHPFVEHFKFVQQFESEGHVAKQTIPAPAQLVLELYRDEAATERTKSFYPDEGELLADIGAAYRTVIAELYAAAVSYTHLDVYKRQDLYKHELYKQRSYDAPHRA